MDTTEPVILPMDDKKPDDGGAPLTSSMSSPAGDVMMGSAAQESVAVPPHVPSQTSEVQPMPVVSELQSQAVAAPQTQTQSQSQSKPQPQPEQKNAEVMEDGGRIFHIEVSKITPNPNQPRRNFNEEGIRELASSIREFGFLQPLVVSRIEEETPMGVTVRYQLIAGERRLMAAKLLGLTVVPAIIREVDLEREKLELAVIENIQRENLNSIETARAFQRLQEEFRMTQREIASKLGKSRETVANSVRLLDLPPYIQDALGRGELTESHGRFLLAIEDPGAQKKLFDDIVNYKLTIRDVKERVQRARSPVGSLRGATPAGALPPELKMIQERLSAELGTPVSIHKKGEEAGKIEISFFSNEELQNILNKFGKEN